MPFDKLTSVMSKTEIEELREQGLIRDIGTGDKRTGFYVLKGEGAQAAE